MEEKDETFEHTYQTIYAKPVVLPDNYKFFILNPFKRIFSKLIVFVFSCIFIPYAFIFDGYRKYGKKNFKKVKDGAMVVCNHCFPKDVIYILTGNLKQSFDVLSLQSNFGWPFFAGLVIKLAGAVPIPEKRDQLRSFEKQLLQALERKHKILIYPEAVLKPYASEIRPFKKGAFRFSINGGKPILPMVWTFHKPKGIKKLFRKKPNVHLHILEPYYPEKQATTRETIEKTMNDIHKIMSDFFNENNEVFDYSPKK